LLRLRGDAQSGMGDWQRALADYTQAVERAPDDWEPRLHRGRAYAQLRQWQLAAADFAKNRDIGFDEPRVWHDFALASLAAGDESSYRRTCADLFRRFSRAADVETARQVVWTAIFAPGAVTDLTPLAAVAERGMKARPKSPMHRLTLAAALIRAGKPALAIETLETALPDTRDHASHCLLLLTLACQQSGKPVEAQQWMDRALETLDDAAREREDPQAWDRRLELELLRSEAERFFKQGKP
jgi:Flp pilus assembly protein TadD